MEDSKSFWYCGQLGVWGAKNRCSTHDIFGPATEDEILAIIRKAPSKSCELDPVPTSLLKKSASEIAPIITKIVNTSLQNGVFSEALKVAHVRPLLKKQNLDRNILKNYYRPVSNLTFLGKTIERVVLARLAPFMQEHDLTEEYQSAYRAFHSTETALLRVPNDVLCAMNQEKIMLLVLLDLSAAFDTVDHDVLFQRLKNRIGIDGVALNWFCINDSISEAAPLTYWLPQGSCVGPGLFPIYTLPLGDIIKRHNLEYHCYARWHIDLFVYRPWAAGRYWRRASKYWKLHWRCQNMDESKFLEIQWL